MLKTLGLCLCLVGFFASQTAFCEEAEAKVSPPPAPKKDVSFSLGVGSLIGDNQRRGSQTWPYGARTYLRVIPMGEFRYNSLSLMGPFASYALVRNPDWEFSLRSGIQGDQYRGEGMEERDWSFFGGLSLRYKLFDISYSRDLQSVSDGSLLSFNVGYRWILSPRIFLLSSVGVTYMDRKYTEYFYGVRDNEALPFREAYHPQESFSYSLNLRPIIAVTERLSLVSFLKFSIFSPEVLNSPTMRKESSFSGLVGLSYKIL